MARTPSLVPIKLPDLIQLLNHRWAAVCSPSIGEQGEKLHEEIVSEIDRQSEIYIKPTQLADLLHHSREVVFEKVAPNWADFSFKNQNRIMRSLKAQNPELFKEISTGEVVMVNLEDREDV